MALSSVPALAQAYQCRVPVALAAPKVTPDGPQRQSAVTGYTLSLSWSPEYCRGRESRATDHQQCSGRGGSFGMVVHGLWPEGARSWPQWCAARTPPRPQDIKAVLAMGDSITAGFGIMGRKPIKDILDEYRGWSWSIGNRGCL